jgi:phosphopantetheinyl transferase (holo-ACP synthase)
MILGIGTDLANIERIERTLERFGDRFRNRVFTDIEQAKAERRADTPGTYAKRWAAKEACSKALGTGLRMGIAWKDMACDRVGRRATGCDDTRGPRGHHPRHADRRSSMGAGLCFDRSAPQKRRCARGRPVTLGTLP